MASSRIPSSYLAKLESCEEKLGYQFSNRHLLLAALTHASGADDRLNSNERLEFLGDSILGFLTCELLFERYPDFSEGDLTLVKSAVVSRATCARIGNELELGKHLLTGKGMDLSKGLPNSLVANALESVLAAIFLDGGMLAARRFLIRHLVGEVRQIVDGNLQTNFKSALQQYAQKNAGAPPSYHVLAEEGPDHRKSFQICAQIGSRRFPPAWGTNKKNAEQRAAGNAIAELEGNPPPFLDEV